MIPMNSTKRARILGLQKERLVELLENLFIRKVGRNFQVHGIEISKEDWQIVANALNSVGPPKDALEWKTSFNTMKSRVRSKMMTVLKSGGTAEGSLSVVDQKIYFMYPHNPNYATVEDILELVPNEEIAFEQQTEIETESSNEHVSSCLATNNGEHELAGSSVSNIDVPETPSGEVHTVPQDSNLSLEALTANNGFQDHDGLTEAVQDSNEEEQDYAEVTDVQNASLIDLLEVFVAGSDKGSCVDESLWDVLAVHLNTLGPSLDVCEWKLELKRITEIQKERLMQLIQNNFTKTVGRFAGSNGVSIKKALWEKFASELNTLGPKKSVKQWKDTIVCRSQDSTSNEISEERRKPPGLSSLKRPKKAKPSTVRSGDGGSAVVNESSGVQHSTSGERPHIPGSSGCKRKENNKRSRPQSDNTTDEDAGSGSPNLTPTVRDKSVQSGKGNTGRIRNRFTSYEMVEKSIGAQERFIEDNNRNHAEMVHLFTTAVNACATSVTSLTDVLRDIFKN